MLENSRNLQRKKGLKSSRLLISMEQKANEKPEQPRQPKQPFERQRIVFRLAKARKFHKMAVRWLFDVNRLRSMYADTESWRSDELSELAEVANLDHIDATREVIQTRKLIDRAAKQLKEYDERDIQKPR